MADFPIGKLKAGNNKLPLVCAEIGANHDGNIDKAMLMLEEIASAGAKVVKFQFYTAEELVADKERIVRWGPEGREVEEPIGRMFDRLSLSKDNFRELFNRARELQLEPFATPFSEGGVDFLVSLNVSCIKIASSDVTHLPLLRYIAQTRKPVILSLGKSTLAETDEAVNCLVKNNSGPLALLHCVASYPSPMEEMNLRVIPILAQLYPESVIGLSDHSMGTTAAAASVALGARIIEKHVTLCQEDLGPDHWFSLKINDLSELISRVEDTYKVLGDSRKRVMSCETTGKQKGTRSIVAAKDIAAGTVLNSTDLKALRPGTGIPPKNLKALEGMIIQRDIRKNSVLTWDHFKKG